MPKTKVKPSPNLPTSMTILGKPIEIRWTDELLEVGSMLGASNPSRQTIWLSTALKSAQLQDTAMHEVLHIISDELKLGLEEETICRLSCGLYSAGARIQALASLEANGC